MIIKKKSVWYKSIQIILNAIVNNCINVFNKCSKNIWMHLLEYFYTNTSTYQI